VEGDRLAAPLFTPSSKAPVGEHDEPINFDEAVALLGGELAERVRETSLALYRAGAAWAESRGIILADTKFEFGLLDSELVVIDEMLTPDSSRFWPADTYAPGGPQPSFDKQYVRDYLLALKWDKTPPGPVLPDEVVAATRARYVEAYERLTGLAWSSP
jgi:phosphoribosylaminoimidazole-succinocarboxamide synthase